MSLSRFASRKKLIAMSRAGSASCVEGDPSGKAEVFCVPARSGPRNVPRPLAPSLSPLPFRWSSGESCETLGGSRSAGARGQSRSTLPGAAIAAANSARCSSTDQSRDQRRGAAKWAHALDLAQPAQTAIDLVQAIQRKTTFFRGMDARREAGDAVSGL
jgi:hypothetical protein